MVLYVATVHSYMLFHSLVELFSIVVAFAVFIITWNSRSMQDNKYLHLLGISYIFIGGLDLMHMLAYKGMHVFLVEGYLANQFWVATRILAAVTMLVGFLLIKRQQKLNSDLVFLSYLVISGLIIASILFWKNFPACYIDGIGQTPFKIYAEYFIIGVMSVVAVLLHFNRSSFSRAVYRLILASVLITIISEFCFTLYTVNDGVANELGHYGKLVAYFLIYKAIVETGFTNPTRIIFSNLKASEEEYRTLASNLPGVIMRFNQKLVCIFSNLTDSNKADVVLERKLKSLVAPFLTTVKEHQLELKEHFKLENGSHVLYYTVHIVPEFFGQGSASSFLVICQDVTELKLAEQQLKDLNETKDKIYSIVAHDLKNPFTSLLSYSQIIQVKSHTLSAEKISQIAKSMNTAAKEAYALLENLLNWASLQSGMLKATPVKICIKTLFENIEKLVSPAIQTKNIALRFVMEEEVGVLADQQMLETILRNLISNAIKFSYEDGLITVSAKKDGQKCIFEISDKGVGIPETASASLFEAGRKYSILGTHKESGTGLGLMLCREFVEANNGEIWLESELGEGSSFFFSLPLASR
ncbi:MAG: histidine kinase [Chitinophagaceae bacterium]|nr:MAG: histidine kinase [Chitinophagaceae bacterium]